MDSLGFGIVFWLIVGFGLWFGLAALLAPVIGRFLKVNRRRHYPPIEAPQGRERLGTAEPSPVEHFKGERAIRAANGQAAADRARARREDAYRTENERPAPGRSGRAA